MLQKCVADFYALQVAVLMGFLLRYACILSAAGALVSTSNSCLRGAAGAALV